MARILNEDGKLPKRIGDFVIYKLDDIHVIRAKSGFTSKALKKHPKYQNCRNNASEFGRVSKTGKAIRVLLSAILPKENNLELVNQFTKKLHSLLVFDALHEKGKRTLAQALFHDQAQQELMPYNFNPFGFFQIETNAKSLKTSFRFKMYEGTGNRVGYRFHQLGFDFETLQGTLDSDVWHFEPYLKKLKNISKPQIQSKEGFRLQLVEIQFFREQEGSLLPVDLGLKSVVVYGVVV